MNGKHGDIEVHRKHLVQVPKDVVRRRLSVFRLEENVLEVLPLVCQDLKIRPDIEIYREYLHPLDPISLDDLKNWFGTPNEVAKKQLLRSRGLDARGRFGGGPVTRVQLSAALPKRRFEFDRLDQKERLAVRQTANNLLYGYVDPEQAKQDSYAAVIDYMLTRARVMRAPVFVCPDLVVCPDNHVVIENIPAAYFNNILIYGSGQITVKGGSKIHAQQIKHVDA